MSTSTGMSKSFTLQEMSQPKGRQNINEALSEVGAQFSLDRATTNLPDQLLLAHETQTTNPKESEAFAQHERIRQDTCKLE